MALLLSHRACAPGWAAQKVDKLRHPTCRLRVNPRHVTRAAPKHPNQSFDSQDELDTDLAEELSRFRSSDAWNGVAKRLDLVWNIGRARAKRSVCSCCQGSGEEECSWCRGTGVMMVGDTVFRSADGHNHCPICKGKGYLACENCRGTGYRASWLQGPDQCRNHL
eukprot:GHRR01001996.1.p1 GENE.GHRR01001996.1~~GHRR01001996.1.p1  ORF type:complete len:165 (+),score=4.74 GHRR01001996.1:193-687(+)